MARQDPAVTCVLFGHSWAVRVRNGHLVELCTACGAAAPELNDEDNTTGGN